MLSRIETDTYCLAAVDIGHFRLFNKMYGRQEGDHLISAVQRILVEIAAENDGAMGYLGADNFWVMVPDQQELIEEVRDSIILEISRYSHTVGFYPLIGVYGISDLSVMPEIMYDRATMALELAKERREERIGRYSPLMEEDLEEEVRLLTEIEEGLLCGEFTFYLQPQCNISSGRIVGAEALVRWIRSTGEVISPGRFIPALEKNGMIDQLDCYVWEAVCRWIGSVLEKGMTPVPVSINVSRLDILSMDVPEYIMGLAAQYQIPEKYIKVEITESAYTENNDRIMDAVTRLRSSGYLVMMDDFGCGYSSLNMLKSIPVDVLKLDMKFLDFSEEESEKGIGILESIVNMARLLRLPIVVEGVENANQEKFVRSMGCRYTQGFYYYRPMPLAQFEEMLRDEAHVDHRGLVYKQVEPLHVREFIDSNFFSDIMLNNVMGPVAFYEMRNQQIEITRVNEQYFRLVSENGEQEFDFKHRFWNHVRDDDRPLLYSIFSEAYKKPVAGADGKVHFIRLDGSCIEVYIHVFFLKEKDGCRQFYASLTNMTGLFEEHMASALQGSGLERGRGASGQAVIQDIEELIPKELQLHMDRMMNGFVVDRLVYDEDGKPIDFEMVYINQTMKDMCGGDIERLKTLSMDAFGDKLDQVLHYMHHTIADGVPTKFHLYSHVSNRYLEFTYYRYAEGYLGCVMRDITDMYVEDKTLRTVMQTYREVYFLQLQDNYYRMLYPDGHRLLERGNYEEAINRHFYTGKIAADDDTKTVRQFLSLDNLRNALKDQDRVYLSYARGAQDGTVEWDETCVAVCERDVDGTPKNAIITIKNMDETPKITEGKS